MNFFNKLFGKKDENKETENAEGKKESNESENAGKYSEECSLCGGTGTEKKWMGQYWHKKCIRSAKRASKKMI